MRHMPTITELMTAFPIHIEETTALADAARLMKEHGCHYLPVMNHHEVTGLLSRADIDLARRPGYPAGELRELTALDMCRREIPKVDLHMRLDVVVDQMVRDDFEAVLIMKQDRLAGIFTLQDAAAGFSVWLKKIYLPDNDPGCA